MLVRAKNTRGDIVLVPERWINHPTLGKGFKQVDEVKVNATTAATITKEGKKNA